MTMHVANQGQAETEKDRVWNRYWTYHNGSVIPAWLEQMVGDAVLWLYHDRIFQKRDRIGWTTGLFHVGCAIELEHRALPATTSRELRRLVARVFRPGYDFAAAALLEAEVMHFQGLRTREISLNYERWIAEEPKRRLDAHPETVKLKREIEAKSLPQGSAENLELLRVLLGISKNRD